MKKFRVLSLALVAAMCFSLLAGCGGGSSASPSPSASAPTASQPAETGSVGESGEITIALITNTTGDYAQYGIPVHNGAKLYIDQLNANGGINGKTIKVLEYDDKADGIETVNAFNLAMDNGITAVIGSVLTGATIALSDATYEVNMPQITASATAAGVTMIDPEDENSEIRTNVFRSCFIDPF